MLMTPPRPDTRLPMKLHIFSDLHHEHPHGWQPELARGADAVLCAGDVCDGLHEAIDLLRGWFPAPTPIITIAGNHSFWQRDMDEEWSRSRQTAQTRDVSLLENEAVVIGGCRFIGATLWTDYALNGEWDRESAMQRANAKVRDHRQIFWRRSNRELFTAERAAAIHATSLGIIEGLLAERFDGPTIVMTHHAPSPRSITPRFRGDELNPSFCSDLEAIIRHTQPFAWIHGHMHSSSDYRIGRTRVISNPHGYGQENAEAFHPALILDTGAG